MRSEEFDLEPVTTPNWRLPYSQEEIGRFFAACSAEEALAFKFFLFSMVRENEGALCQVQDLDFKRIGVYVRENLSPEPRFVPLPSDLMGELKSHCAGKAPTSLVFANPGAGLRGQFLEQCKKIAKRAKIPTWSDFTMYRWRLTGASKRLEAGAPVCFIQRWLGHKLVETTVKVLGLNETRSKLGDTWLL